MCFRVLVQVSLVWSALAAIGITLVFAASRAICAGQIRICRVRIHHSVCAVLYGCISLLHALPVWHLSPDLPVLSSVCIPRTHRDPDEEFPVLGIMRRRARQRVDSIPKQAEEVLVVIQPGEVLQALP